MFSVAENLTDKAKIGAAGNQKQQQRWGKYQKAPLFPLFQAAVHKSSLPVCFMKLHNLLFQLFRLVRGQFKFTDIIWAVQIRIVVSQLGLDRVGTQQSQSRKGTGQPPRNDVLSKLKTQVIPGQGEKGKILFTESIEKLQKFEDQTESLFLCH